MRVAGFMSAHLLEGSLRAAARKENHFLKRNVTNTKDSTMTISFVCAKGASMCKFSVKIVTVPSTSTLTSTSSSKKASEEEGEEIDFAVLNVNGNHPCRAEAAAPSKALQKILDAWVSVRTSSAMSFRARSMLTFPALDSPRSPSDLNPALPSLSTLLDPRLWLTSNRRAMRVR
jgi:hypothetical protein